MPITAVRSTSLYVTDQDRAIEFYTKTLGFALKARIPMGLQGDGVELVPPGGNTAVILHPRATMPDGPQRPGIVLRCTDTVMERQDLARKGVRFSQEPTQTPWGYVVAQFEDPDGNWIGLTNQPF